MRFLPFLFLFNFFIFRENRNAISSENVSFQENTIQIYVSPQGDDGNTGDIDHPLASLEGAKLYIRQKLKPLKKAVIVNFRGGSYFFNRPVEFKPMDSGTPEFPITYRAYNNETVIFSGGIEIKGKWQQVTGKNYWSIEVPAARNNKWVFRQLYSNDKELTWARYPNKGKWMFVQKKGDRNTIYADSKVKPDWAGEKNALLSIVLEKEYFSSLVNIDAVNPSDNTIKISGTECQGETMVDNQFFIEGVFSELDDENEWYLNSKTGVLYFIPPAGEDPNNMHFIANNLNNLVRLEGNIDNDQRVQYINFENLQFSNTGFALNHIDVRTVNNAAIELICAKNCKLLNNKIYNTGSTAIWLHLDCTGNEIEGNELHDLGGSGVLLTSALFGFQRKYEMYTDTVSHPKSSGMAPLQNKITKNKIYNGGLVRYYGAAIQLDSRPSSTIHEAGNLISHNEIYNISRCGIFVFKNQGGNLIEYNLIHDVMLKVVDGGGIHIAAVDSSTKNIFILNNTIYNVFCPMVKKAEQDLGAAKAYRHSYGIYLDIKTSNVDVENNIIWGCNWGVEKSGAFLINGGGNNNISKNNFNGRLNIVKQEKVKIPSRVLQNSVSQGFVKSLPYNQNEVGTRGNHTNFTSWSSLAAK